MIGSWADPSANALATDFLDQDTDARVSESMMAARTGAAYDGRAYSVSTQNQDQYNALDKYVTVQNSSFEAPAQSAGGFTYYSGTVNNWTYSSAGVAANNSPWYDVAAPAGSQAAFIQGGSVSQSLTLAAGRYTVFFSAIGRGGGYGPGQFKVQVDGTDVSSWTEPSQTAWTAYSVPFTTTTSGSHTISFVARGDLGDKSPCIDGVSLGWGYNCTGYGFLYVYYNHADNPNCYMGIGIDDLYKIWLNGEMVASFTTAGGRGGWTPDGSGSATDFKGPFTLKQGWNRLLIKANNGSGGYGWSVRLANANRTYIGNCTYYYTDATAPSNPTSCTDSAGSADNTWQNTVSDPNFTWSGAGDAQGSGEGVSGIRGYYYYFGNSSSGTSTSYLDVAAHNPSAVASDGTYYMRVRTYDYALNNAAAWATLYTFKYDATAPNPITGFSSSSPGSSDTTWYNSAANLVWTWTAATDAMSGLDGYAIVQDQTAATQAGATKNSEEGTVSYTMTGPQASGEYWLHVRSKDVAGNWDAAADTQHRRIRIDRTPPTDVSLTIGTVTTDSIAVTGAGTDAHSGVNGSTGYSYSCTGQSDSGGKGTSHTWTGLTANTEYTGLKVTVSDQAVSTPNTAASSPQSQWTLSVAPAAGSVTPDNATVCMGSTVTWAAAGGFGAGKIAKYKYAWNQNGSHTWTGSEADWSSGTIQTVANAEGTWYLHVKGYNGADVENGTYAYAVTVPTGALTWTGAAGTWDFSTGGLWQDSVPVAVNYCDSHAVILDDHAGASAPVITLDTTVTPTDVLNDSTKNYTISGTGKISGTATLTKQGDSTLTISTVNDYSGGTTVSGGTLLVNGSVGGGPVTVQNTATLGGSGKVVGAVKVASGGTLAPGNNAIGTLTLGAAPTLGGTVAMEINQATSAADKLDLTSGTFTYGGALALTVTAGTLTGGEEYDLFDFSGTSSGSFATITTTPALGEGLNWWQGRLATEGKLRVNRAPTGAADHSLIRAKGVSIKIKKADLTRALMGPVSDPDSEDGDAASYDGLVSMTSNQGVTLTENSAYYFYAPINDNADWLQYKVKDNRGGLVTRKLNIMVTPFYGSVKIRHDGGGQVSLSFWGIPGYSYYVQRSCGDTEHFADLEEKNPVTCSESGLVTFTDTPGCNPAFYRLRTP